MRKAIAPGEILKDKRVLIGGAGVLVAGAAAAAFYAFGNQQATTEDTAPAVVSQAPVGGGPGSPGGPGAPGRPPVANTARPKPSPSPVAALALDRSTSFDNIPKAIPGGTGAAAPVQGAPTPAPAPAADTSKPAPIRAGVVAAGSRVDPFVSRLIEPFQRPAAYLFVAPLRLAGRPVPPAPPKSGNPDDIYGPLPFVQRRVAGILYNGQVSAILETGGVGAFSQVVQPGTSVDSGIPGVDSLIVDTITPTSLTLRARDGRTTSVSLSGAPEGTLPVAPGGGVGAPPGGGGPPSSSVQGPPAL